MKPVIATVVTNPTNRDLKYQWLGPKGMIVKAGQTVTVPYCAYTMAKSATIKGMMGKAIETKMALVSYKTTLKTESVANIEARVSIEVATKKKAVKPEPPEKEEPKKEEPKEAREEIIVATGEGKDAVSDSEDLVQKFTGQETTTMRDAMGWEPPETDDPRTPQETDVVKMQDAMTENVGDEEEKAAAAAAKEQKATKQKAPAKKDDEAVDPKKSAAAKKAAATRKKNAEAKKAAGKK